ncbi:hypothetical protein B0H17DRAFT_936829 [Mycena rosella]|uniref:BTB domain-containing protein n=1 Tax=Mycena rosella TaxID=1033263 RepID=A0AAD7DEI4_MYCRO|nr:hypothetical protein B0H17DRAFT_936829 [Mycena rosella]
MEVDNEPNVPVRVQELWFDDGNLIIAAGFSLFRVYRGILAARSSVFQDMLSLPQPPDSELVEGCPLVRMHDTAAEVTVFLKAIFDSEFFQMYPSPTTLDVVAGVLRLSQKYSVDYLRRRALGHLSSAFFTTLSARDAWDDDSGTNLLGRSKHHGCFHMPSTTSQNNVLLRKSTSWPAPSPKPSKGLSRNCVKMTRPLL